MGVKEEILKSVQTIVKGMMDKAPFDKTRMAQVIAINNNTLDVRMDGIKYTNVKVYGNVNNIGVGDIVKIIIPENQTSRMFALSPNEKVELNTCPFPVGSIYMSMNSANPSTIWEGTRWSRISQGKVLVGVDENDADFADGVSGGAKGAWRHTHEVAGGGTAATGANTGDNSYLVSGHNGNAYPTHMPFTNKENGSTNNTLPVDIANMPPYMTCYIWQRLSDSNSWQDILKETWEEVGQKTWNEVLGGI